MPATVLVVDNHPAILRLLSDLLSDEGHRVLAARDGAEALAVAGRTRPDAVLSDVGMPALDGRALAARFARWAPPVPVVLMSAVASAGGPGVPFLRKPFELDDVLAAVRDALRTGG